MRGWRLPAIAVDSALALVLTVLYLPGATDAEPAWVVIPLRPPTAGPAGAPAIARENAQRVAERLGDALGELGARRVRPRSRGSRRRSLR